MRIAVVHDWEPSVYQELTWHDGLAAAIKILATRHDISFFTCGEKEMILQHSFFPINILNTGPNLIKAVKDFAPDVILHWADFTRPNAVPMTELGIPMAICFAGGEAVTYNTPYFDHIFVESEVYKTKLNEAGYDNVSIAFGTNTELFKPVSGQPKLYDTLFPGTFALWKRHQLYAQAVQGLRSLAVGYIYEDHEQECWQDCLKNGVMIMPHVSAETLRYLYAASRVVVVPSLSSGGSQRTVLEAMAMNIPLVVTDSDKFDYARGHGVWEADPTKESIRGIVDVLLDGEPEVDTRRYVLDNWSEFNYAEALEKGLKSIV